MCRTELEQAGPACAGLIFNSKVSLKPQSQVLQVASAGLKLSRQVMCRTELEQAGPAHAGLNLNKKVLHVQD